MQILLKNLLKEIDQNDPQNPLKVQIYCDMDGVLADLDAGFKKVSGGLAVKEFHEQEKYKANPKLAQKDFWKAIASDPNFWLNLPLMPDAKVLWDFIKDNFKDPAPVILSAGQGHKVIDQKTKWIRQHISPTAKVIIASKGTEKWKYVIDQPYTTHVLVDDTQKNLDIWDDVSKHRIGVLHKDAASSIEQLKKFIVEK